MFPSGGTAWGDDKNLSHMLATGEPMGKALLFLKQTSDEYGEYRVGFLPLSFCLDRQSVWPRQPKERS